MANRDLAQALERAANVLQRRPSMGLHEDAPATARWDGGTQVVSSHANGTQVVTDMPQELGGGGTHVTPGWFFRAGLAACATTSIAMVAARENIELRSLEVRASSRSDTRGLLGIDEADGAPISAGPRDMELRVKISADGVSPERLRALVESALTHSPIPTAVREGVAMQLNVEVGGS
jgi:uncharacterized OsmC-like protein